MVGQWSYCNLIARHRTPESVACHCNVVSSTCVEARCVNKTKILTMRSVFVHVLDVNPRDAMHESARRSCTHYIAIRTSAGLPGSGLCCESSKMAPKKRSKKQQQKEEQQAAQAESTAAGSEDPVPKRRRQLARRDTELAVDRLIKEWFDDFSPYDIDHKLWEGKCLRQRLLEEKRSRKSDGGRISTVFLRQMRERYAPAESTRQSLVWTGEQEIDPAIQSGIRTLFHINPSLRSKEPLLAALSTCTSMTQRTMIVCLRWLVDQNLHASGMSREIGMRMVTTIVRLELHKKYAADLLKVTSTLETLLSEQYSQNHREKMEPETWFANFRHILAILPVFAELEEIFAYKGKLCEISEKVVKATKSSAVAMRLFGPRLGGIMVDNLSSQMDKAVKKLKPAELTMEKMLSTKAGAWRRAKCEAALASSRRCEFFFQKKKFASSEVCRLHAVSGCSRRNWCAKSACKVYDKNLAFSFYQPKKKKGMTNWAASIAMTQSELVHLVDELEDAMSVKPSKRTIDVTYRGIEISIPVIDLRGEIELRMAAVIKSASSGAEGGIPPLPWEEPVMGKRKTVCTLDAGVLRPLISAREALHSMVQDAALNKFSDVADLMSKKMSHFQQFDATWQLDTMASQLVATKLATLALQAKIRECLPDQAKEVGVSKLREDLTKLKESQLFVMLDQSRRADLELSLEVAGKIERGVCPSAANSCSGFLAEVMKRFLGPYAMVLENEWTHNGGPQPVRHGFGKECLAELRLAIVVDPKPMQENDWDRGCCYTTKKKRDTGKVKTWA